MNTPEQVSNSARRTTAPKGVLTDRAVEAAKPDLSKNRKITDGNGLFVLVLTSGVKSFRFKYNFAGKEKLMTLGQYSEMRLAAARAKRDAARALVVAGIDPMAERKSMKLAQRLAALHSFKSVAQQWWNTWKVGNSEQHAGQVWRRFEANGVPLPA